MTLQLSLTLLPPFHISSLASLSHFATQILPSAVHDTAAGVAASKEKVPHLLLTTRDLRDARDFLSLSLFEDFLSLSLFQEGSGPGFAAPEVASHGLHLVHDMSYPDLKGSER